MKLYTIIYNGKETPAVQDENSGRLYPLSMLGIGAATLEEFIIGCTDEQLKLLRDSDKSGLEGVAAEDAVLCAPIPRPRQDVVCLGINYAKHMEEAVRFRADAFKREAAWPIYFSKRVNRAIGSGEKICSFPGLVDGLDYETELTVILGRDAFCVSEEDAFDYVFGYTIINDVSARNLQTRHKQWYFGKSLDTFTPMGPCIATKDAFDVPPKVRIQTWINGELRQDGSSELLLNDIPHVISELSQGMTLQAGTIIAMGTPAGVGMGFDPPKFLKTGDVVKSYIEGIGVLENVID